ncbi:MAG: hypothetical protein K0S57_3525 [Ramlibacter sp.]|nr:hypothetical protein [Ramlibacter sp.]
MLLSDRVKLRLCAVNHVLFMLNFFSAFVVGGLLGGTIGKEEGGRFFLQYKAFGMFQHNEVSEAVYRYVQWHWRFVIVHFLFTFFLLYWEHKRSLRLDASGES